MKEYPVVKPITVIVPIALHLKFKRLAVDTGESLTALFNRAISEFIEKQNVSIK